MTTSGGPIAYVVLFLLMALAGFTVPAIGTVVVGTAAVLASQHELDINTVIVVSILGAFTGGLIGYWIGVRWGEGLFTKPGWREEQRKKTLEKGKQLYTKWGWLAVFVIPSMVAGIAAMRFLTFVIFYFIAAASYQLATALPAYAAGNVASGNSSPVDLGRVAVAAILIFAILRLRRRRKARVASALLNAR